ncbi:MAG TPA: OmpA family protein [Caulobacteraceae bacterium]
MRSEVDKRYDAAVKLTQTPEIINAADTRFTWASEAKVACGIAIGFLKTSTVDEDSVNRCDDYSHRMTVLPPPPPPPPQEPPPPPVETAAPACSVKLPIVFYFAFDVDTPPPEANAIAAKTVESLQQCGWRGIKITGHADRAGSDAYNQKLSERRARHVADLLVSTGAPAGQLSVEGKGESSPAVQTPDGVREPLNRRVEITPAGGQ